MTFNIFKRLLFITLLMAFSFVGYASQEADSSKSEPFNAKELIMHHVKDAYRMHLITLNEGKPNEKHISLPLPIILWTDNGIVTFMSSEFHHDYNGEVIVEKNGMRFVNVHEKIYELNTGETSVVYDDAHYPTNASKPLDFSITRNVFM